MPNLRSKTHAQEAYDSLAKRAAGQEAEDTEVKRLGELWIRRLEEDLRQGKDTRGTTRGCKVSSTSFFAMVPMD